ncbi:MAG: hypothetical protein P8X96_22925 [Desulfobacteraceae bacterium]
MKTIKYATMAIMTVLFFSMAALNVYAGPLDGKSFTGMAGKMGKKSSEQDEIRFENGQFQSVGCEAYGFGSAPYMAVVDGDKIHFVADTYSKKTGRIAWVGTIVGDKADATFLWYKRNKHVEPKQIKWFKGHAK